MQFPQAAIKILIKKNFQETLGIYEYPEFETDNEQKVAEDSYRKKWKDIYPLDKEVWPPFGQGNGMMEGDKLENVTITHISDLKYNVLVEYREGMVFSNNLLLIPQGDSFLIDFIDTVFKEEKAMQVKFSDPGIDKVLPIFLENEANTNLYEDTSIESAIVATLNEEDIMSLIGLTAVKDAENRTWYKCYYPKQQIQGWTRQVSHWDFTEDEKYLPFLQNLTLANLQLGANPRDAKRLLGKPKSEHTKTGSLETSGYIDEDYIITTTTMEYDGIELIYQDDTLIHAEITRTGNSFGWLSIGHKEWDKDAIMRKFKLTEDSFYDDKKGLKVINMYWDILALSVYLDAEDLVKTIKFHYGS